MPASGGCLYECLKEAHLESYYTSFVRHGIIKCEGLATLSMHEYSRFGVLSMEDRVRLFKLVQIVKSVLADGLHCQHEYPTLRANNIRTHLTVDVHTRTISELARIQGHRNNTNVEVKPIPRIPAKPSHGITRNKVEYNPGSDTPVFKCRKILTFSDSEEEEDEQGLEGKQEQNSPKPVAVAAVKPTTAETGNNQSTTGPGVKVADSTKDEAKVKQQAHVCHKPKPPRVFYVDLESPCPAVRTPETQVERQIDIGDMVDMDDKNDSGNSSASTQYRSAFSTTKRTNASSGRPGSRNISFELNQSDLSNYSADSASRRPPSSESGLYSRSISSRSRSASPPKPCASQNSYDLAYNNTDSHLETLGEQNDVSKNMIRTEDNQDIIVGSPSRDRSPPRPISAFFVDAVTQKDHAYFPQFQPPKKFETHVETVVHNSEYDYGVPGLDSSPKTSVINFTSSDRRSMNRKPVSRSRNRDERIRVCVRKRPLLKKELKRQEADIVTTQDSDAVVVEESKVTIDLSKYIQKVRIFIRT